MNFENIPYIRWMVTNYDLPKVMEIDEQCFTNPWSKKQFVDCLSTITPDGVNCIGMSMFLGNRLIGFMIYELHEDHIHLLKFAIHQDYRKNGYGKIMADRLKSRLSAVARTNILVEIDEYSLDAQLFFKKQNFLATSVLKNFYENAECDAYQMKYILPAAKNKYSPTNRIANMVK